MDLPDDLQLPLRTGEPHWYWLGGRPALDLVNTRRERWWRSVETLVTPRDLVRWLQRAGLATSERTRADVGVLERARALREAIDAGVTAVVSGHAVPADALATIDAWLPDATVGQRLELGETGVAHLVARAPDDPLRHALALVALDAARMLGTDERTRVRTCASEICSARFYDRSPRATRRWCSMRACGNVDKARRHRASARSA